MVFQKLARMRWWTSSVQAQNVWLYWKFWGVAQVSLRAVRDALIVDSALNAIEMLSTFWSHTYNSGSPLIELRNIGGRGNCRFRGSTDISRHGNASQIKRSFANHACFMCHKDESPSRKHNEGTKKIKTLEIQILLSRCLKQKTSRSGNKKVRSDWTNETKEYGRRTWKMTQSNSIF